MKATHSPLGRGLRRGHSRSISSFQDATINATNAYSGKAKALHTAAHRPLNEEEVSFINSSLSELAEREDRQLRDRGNPKR